MDENQSPESLPPAKRAEFYYQNGLELKKAGNAEAALTEFRRAVLSDTAHFQAQLEIGRLCKTRALVEPIFARYAYDAFRAAAHLDLNHQEAHNEYIFAAQKMGRLDDILLEYENLAKFNPDNELIARCKKNIITISMAMVPEKVNISSIKASGTMKKMLLLGAIGGLFFGFVILVAPALMKGSKLDFFKPDMVKPLVVMGIAFIGGGLAGLFVLSRMK